MAKNSISSSDVVYVESILEEVVGHFYVFSTTMLCFSTKM